MTVKTLLSLIQIVVCVVLIASVIMQPRKQGRFGGIFGGATQADVATTRQWQRFSTLSKITVVCATLYMILVLALLLL